jgi:hypothetical protein
MVTGQLRCIGSPQHLKTQYGTGFHIAVKTTADRHDEVLQYVVVYHRCAQYVVLYGIDTRTTTASMTTN